LPVQLVRPVFGCQGDECDFGKSRYLKVSAW